MIYGDVDLERLSRERMRQTTFGQSTRRHANEVDKFQVVSVPASLPDAEYLPLMRAINRFPYVPSNPATRDERCAEVYNIQMQGLLQRLGAARISKVVIGVSGGLDST